MGPSTTYLRTLSESSKIKLIGMVVITPQNGAFNNKVKDKSKDVIVVITPQNGVFNNGMRYIGLAFKL